MVVATLIANMSILVATNPPGGHWQVILLLISKVPFRHRVSVCILQVGMWATVLCIAWWCHRKMIKYLVLSLTGTQSFGHVSCSHNFDSFTQILLAGGEAAVPGCDICSRMLLLQEQTATSSACGDCLRRLQCTSLLRNWNFCAVNGAKHLSLV